MTDHASYVTFMRVALEEAEEASRAGELPIGGAVYGGGELLRRTQTRVRREGSIVAHGELTGLMSAGMGVYSCKRPLVLVTTLEPCLMCLGAAMQCGVDVLIYGMKCAPDGAASAVGGLGASGQRVPEIVGGVLEQECVEVFRHWPQAITHPAYGYVSAILAAYGVSLSTQAHR